MKDVLAFGVEPSTRRYRLRLARYQALAQTVADMVRRRPIDALKLRLLDVGSGNGRTLRYLEAEGVAERVEFIGLELNERRIAGMYRRERWRIVRGNAERELPFATATFDCAVCEQVLEHLHHPDRVLREIGRVLKPGGIMIAGVPSFPPVAAQVRRHLVPVLDNLLHRKSDHVQGFSLGSFRQMIRQTGMFGTVEARGFRLISGGPFAPLEDYRWFWRANGYLGRLVPWMCVEVQAIVERAS